MYPILRTKYKVPIAFGDTVNSAHFQTRWEVVIVRPTRALPLTHFVSTSSTLVSPPTTQPGPLFSTTKLDVGTFTSTFLLQLTPYIKPPSWIQLYLKRNTLYISFIKDPLIVHPCLPSFLLTRPFGMSEFKSYPYTRFTFLFMSHNFTHRKRLFSFTVS